MLPSPHEAVDQLLQNAPFRAWALARVSDRSETTWIVDASFTTKDSKSTKEFRTCFVRKPLSIPTLNAVESIFDCTLRALRELRGGMIFAARLNALNYVAESARSS